MKRISPSTVFGRNGLLAAIMPGFEYRYEQEQMMGVVEEAIAHHDVCLVEAGTGIGKTLAYLVPAIVSRRQVVVSTATRALMDQIYERDIPLLKQLLDVQFTATLLKGRNNYLCLERLNRESQMLISEDRDLINRVRRWAKETNTGDTAELTDIRENDPLLRRLTCSLESCLGRACPELGRCFLFAARARARESDLVVTNHHLFFADLAAREGLGGGLLPDDAIIIFDEAHGLEDVVAEHFGRHVTTSAIGEMCREAADFAALFSPSESRVILGAASRIPARFESLLRALVPADGRVEVSVLSSDAQRAWHELDADLELMSHESRAIALEISLITDISARVEAMREAIALVLNSADASFVRVAERKGATGSLSAVPVDVSECLRRQIFLTSRTVVLTSATLTVAGSTGFFRTRLGVPEGAIERVLSSPFEYEKQVLIYLPDPMPDPNDEAFFDAFVKETTAVLEATQGRAFVLFTSHAALQRTVGRIGSSLPWPIFVQGQAPRDELLRRFRTTPNSCLFGTYTFWEGVDVVGQALSCVVIDRLPFDPPDDPVIRARAEAVRLKGGEKFRDYQLPLAVIRLRQGFGRLIRHRTDRGVVAIMDPRIRTKSYGEVFLQSLPKAPITNEIRELQKWCRKHL